jgi:hypothetical protein
VTMIKKARLWIALALALALVSILLPSMARAHNGEYHATSLVEGGSTKVWYDPAGVEPNQEWWKECVVAIKHRIENNLDYYRPTFKCASFKGVFAEDDSISAEGEERVPTEYTIKIGLLSRDRTTGISTPLTTYDAFFTTGNGYSYGCWGDGRETQVAADWNKDLIGHLLVFGKQKYWSTTYLQWRDVPGTSGYHHTKTYRLAANWWMDNPPSMGHLYETDPVTGYFLNWSGSTPQAYIRGYCPLWEDPPLPHAYTEPE